MKQDKFSMTLLFDYYGELLTEKQKTCFDLYYNQDLSLSEIAAEAQISRQGVHDTLVRSEALLEHFESSIGCIAREASVQKALGEICQAASQLRELPQAQALADSILAAAGRIKE